jgi:hypothetical protein
MFALVACGNVQSTTAPIIDAQIIDAQIIDAPVGAPIDSTPIDSPPPAPDCATYCMAIQANCTGSNAQYPDPGHCMATCGSFSLGMTGDTSGNTLGCRIYHAGAPAMMAPATHCVHAGPGGDKTSAAPPGTCGDACTSFCTLEIKACGVTGDAGGNGQYADMAACMAACAGFDKTHLYTVTSAGDSLACRLYHATNAAISGNAATHCQHTSAAPAGANNPCLAGKPPTP